MSVMAIVPARIGSKGIPRKNFRPLAGRVLWMRAATCAWDAGIKDVVITTDVMLSETVIAPNGQAQLHFLHAPDPLHTDTCSVVDVVLDVLQRVPGPPDQKILLVQPTQPLRQAQHLRQALALLETWNSVASAIETEPVQKLYYEQERMFAPVLSWEESRERRQDARKTFMCDGTVYGFWRDWFEIYRAFLTCDTAMMKVDSCDSCKLDTPADWLDAERRLREREG
jgi:CMP-N-acetylneuraminic acid synthetase